MNWEDILPHVEKPSRYIGGEIHASRKDRRACRLAIALAFPDTYEVGMSHLGIQILYSILNGNPAIAAERCYAPWPDMEEAMRRHRLPLFSLESHTPLHEFDIVGFSLQYELSYTNVLNMLELGGIPLRSNDRGENHPVIIAGGPCAFNPAPMSDFIDAFVIGEGEEVVSEIAMAALEAKEKGRSRRDIIAALAAIEGVYVPALHTGGERIKKRLVVSLDTWLPPPKPLVPLMKTIHDRITLEIARGCTRGCRFCQAGMVWRPVRERNPRFLEQAAEALLAVTGYREISLLSLSSGDYGCIEPLLASLMDRYYEKRVALALPSLRVETLSANLIEVIKRVRKTSFTLALEAGTQRLRNIINKGNTEADLLATSQRVFEAGWKSVKLYFMLGLPGEQDEDLEGIVDLGYKVMREGKNRKQVTLSLSTFVPKPHTPFQWQRQITLEETLRKQEYLKGRLRNRHVNVKWHDSRMSLLEGMFSRGDERLGILIEKAFRLGCRFDGWSDRFRFDLWEKAMEEMNIRSEDYLRERGIEEAFPWDRIVCGVSRGFLREEAKKALTGELTPDCRAGNCGDCGVCDHTTISPAIVSPSLAISAGNAADTPAVASPEPTRLRFKFTKRGIARFLSHLEVSAALIRAINQGGLSFVYSQGFHPHPRLSFAIATSVGMESAGEFADMTIEDIPADFYHLLGKINAALPEGLKILSAEETPANGPSLSELLRGFEYEVSLPPEFADDDFTGLEEHRGQFLRKETFTIAKEKEGKTIIRDIRPLVNGITLDRENRRLHISLSIINGTSVKPADILTRALGMDADDAKTMRILKTDTHFAKDRFG
ncbi:MAG: TIGR03960 family B12-binding radical SAM protein [Deltaproteobacteria bacterium]|nr:TIGR03960 family B12-binding radical SAM protein [Deltaproteobacteria bacterium]